MILADLKKILELLISVGVEEVAIEPHENGVLLRGAGDSADVVVFDVYPSSAVDANMGVQSLRALLSRIDLFDPEKASVEISERDGAMESLTIKQGRRKVSHRCGLIQKLNVPKMVPDSIKEGELIEFGKDYAQQLDSAIASISQTGSKEKRCISLSVENGTATISVFDGEHDTFSDEFQTDCDDIRKVSWPIKAFQRVMNRSIDTNGGDTISLKVSKHGTAHFNVGMIDVIIAPYTR